MTASKKIVTQIYYRKCGESQLIEGFYNWLAYVRILFDPKVMKWSTEAEEAFSLATLQEKIAAFKGGDFTLCLRSDTNQGTFEVRAGVAREKHTCEAKYFFRKANLIFDYTLEQMKTVGLFASHRQLAEYDYHNTKDIVDRLHFESGREIEQLPKIRRENGEIEIDCNQFAGYDSFYRGYCFTSCWRMYFHKEYQKVIPLRLLEEVQQVEQSKWLSPTVFFVELYQNPLRWQNDNNRHFQRLFRDQLGVDQLTCDNGVGVLREPCIEYAISKNQVQTVQYQNEQLQPTTKKQATHFVTRTFDDILQQQQMHRIHGCLNSQAFFPWVDERKMCMMKYLVLDPSYTLDGGLSAYEYYLRHHLEIPVDPKDNRYKEYLVLLSIYLPDNLAKDFPYDKLKANMPDIHFSRVKGRKKPYIDLKKGRNHLRVKFVPLSQMTTELTNLDNFQISS